LVLLAARAARELGEAQAALHLLASALPSSGEMGPALRVEAARAALDLGRDPWSWLSPLLARTSAAAHRHGAINVLHEGWSRVPEVTLGRLTGRDLPKSLRREARAALAARHGDRSVALRVIDERVGDRAALAAGTWLAAQPRLSARERIVAADALLAGAAWRRARDLLADVDPPSDGATAYRLAYLRGRAAYRLGDLDGAARFFDRAGEVSGGSVAAFNAAVQRARVAELSGDLPGASAFWDRARAAAPNENEGWDGVARIRTLQGRGADAVAQLLRAPPSVVRAVGPRLAAMLLARTETAAAATLASRLPPRLPVVRCLRLAGAPAQDQVDAAGVLADPRMGEWRELVAARLVGSTSVHSPSPAREPMELARLAVTLGVDAARTSLLVALLADPAWAPIAGCQLPEPAWDGPAHDLAAAGLERDAAALYPHRFPSASPADLAWTARWLAAWGNRPAALAAGARLWGRLGSVPAALLPEPVLAAVLPDDLVRGCARAAAAHGIPGAWLVAIVRQESGFDAAAVSPAGAVGLAQLVPEVGLRLGASRDELLDEQRALDLAATEVARLSEAFGGQLAAVAAAYNAGDVVTRTWLAALGTCNDPLVFAAAIPYRETAAYVLAVMEGAQLARAVGN
jgi:soluble lytic murein transglycosylase-like protein